MPMETTTLIVIFLAFTSVTVVTNTLLIWFAYKGFANVSGKVTEAVREIETSSTTRAWLQSWQTAAEQAVAITDMTKQQMAEFGPQFAEFHGRFQFLLAEIDTKVERVTTGVSENATMVRDVVSEKAELFASAAAGVMNVLSFIHPPTEDDLR